MSGDDPPDGWEAYRRGEWRDDVPVVHAETLRWLLVAAPRPVPGRSARLAVFFTVGTVMFATWPPAPDGDGAPEDVQPAVYALDLLLRVIDFGQERAFSAHGSMQWTVVVLVSAGWILATTAAAGANRVLRRA